MSNKKNYPLLPGQTLIEPYYTQVPTEEYEANMRELKQLREITAGSRTTIDDIAEIKTLTSEVNALRKMNAKAQEEIATLKENKRWRKFPDEKPHENESIVLVAFFSKLNPTIYTLREALYSEGLEEFFNPMDHTESWNIEYWLPRLKAPEVE